MGTYIYINEVSCRLVMVPIVIQLSSFNWECPTFLEPNLIIHHSLLAMFVYPVHYYTWYLFVRDKWLFISIDKLLTKQEPYKDNVPKNDKLYNTWIWEASSAAYRYLNLILLLVAIGLRPHDLTPYSAVAMGIFQKARFFVSNLTLMCIVRWLEPNSLSSNNLCVEIFKRLL